MAAMMTMSAVSGGCTHASANVPVDSPKLMSYQAPDIDEITGIDSDSDADAAPADKPAASPAAQPASNPAQKPHH
jgi:hypothetical protein